MSAPSYRSLWLGAAALPVVAHGASLLVNVEPSAWSSMPPALRWALAPDALLNSAGAVLVTTPVAAVALASRYRSARPRPAAWRVAVRIVGAVLLLTAVSGVLTFAWTAGRDDATLFVARSHLTLAAVALALGAWGALCGAWFRDQLDAAAVSFVVPLIAAVGLLVGGASVADFPRPVVAVALAASPIVAVASAAHVDIVRMDLLYQISPLAHMQMDYPQWYSASGGYLAIAAVCFTGFTRKFRTSLPPSRN